MSKYYFGKEFFYVVTLQVKISRTIRCRAIEAREI